MPCCDHYICQKEIKGVGVCIVDPTQEKILLGLERFGKYRGKFNLCAGSLEPEDDACAVKAAMRELREEFKVHLDESEFTRHFGIRTHNNGVRFTLRYTMVGPTPIFIGHFDVHALKYNELTAQMKRAIDDDMLPGTQKEMEESRWFPWTDHDSMEWSRFARVALKKVMQRFSKPGTFGNPKFSTRQSS